MPKFFHLITPIEAFVDIDDEEVFTQKHDQSDWGDEFINEAGIKYYSLTMRIELLRGAITKSSIFFDEELKAELEKCEGISEYILGFYNDHKIRSFIFSETIEDDEPNNLHKIPADDWLIEDQLPQDILSAINYDKIKEIIENIK